MVQGPSASRLLIRSTLESGRLNLIGFHSHPHWRAREFSNWCWKMSSSTPFYQDNLLILTCFNYRIGPSTCSPFTGNIFQLTDIEGPISLFLLMTDVINRTKHHYMYVLNHTATSLALNWADKNFFKLLYLRYSALLKPWQTPLKLLQQDSHCRQAEMCIVFSLLYYFGIKITEKVRKKFNRK